MNARAPFKFGDWTVDPATGTLNGPAGQRHLAPKLIDLLVALVERSGYVASRDELLRAVWGERSEVSDVPLTRAVAELRRILGDGRSDAPAYIETIPKRGYRAIAPVRVEPAPGLPVEVAARVATGAANRTGSASPPSPLRAVGAALAPADPAASLPAGATIAARRGIGTRAWRLPSLLLAIAAAVLVAAYSLRAPRASSTAPVALLRVAILPFEDRSYAADRQYFADGVQEELVRRLTEIPGLQIAGRSGVDAYRGSRVPVREIARQLEVDAVMRGTVRYAADEVRLTAQLIDGATETEIWADSVESPLTLENLFGMQAEIADRVAAKFARAVPVGDGRRATPLPTASLAAYEAFLLGKYHYRRRQPGDVQASIEQFQVAVNEDPAFAEAWDWLAYAWNEAGVELGWTTPARAFPRARAAALRALELDPDLATATALLGYLRGVYDWDWQGSVGELERAVAAAPRESGAVWSYALVLSLLGRHEEAVAEVRDLANETPRDGRQQQQLAWRLIDAGQYAAAGEAANAALAGGAEPGQIRELLGMAAFGAGNFGVALAELEKAVALQQGAAPAVGRLAAAYARVGREADARVLLTELEARGNDERANVATLARVYTAFGERDRALTLLEQGAQQRQRDVLGIGSDPFFASLYDEPRFSALLARMGLPAATDGRTVDDAGDAGAKTQTSPMTGDVSKMR